MPEYDLPMTGLRQRPTNTMPTLRNVRVTAGDDFTITASIYSDEDATALLPVTGQAWASFFDIQGTCGPAGWNLWGGGMSGCEWDYGSLGFGRYIPKRPILQVLGTYGSTAGTFVFTMPPTNTQLWLGRYAFTIQLVNFGFGATIIRGIMDVEPGLVFPGTVLGVGNEFFNIGQSMLGGSDPLDGGPPAGTGSGTGGTPGGFILDQSVLGSTTLGGTTASGGSSGDGSSGGGTTTPPATYVQPDFGGDIQ